MASIFTKIIRGEIPSYRVYEDRHTLAFLDIGPRQPGHTLVVPKREVDEMFDLPAADFEALWKAVRIVGDGMKRALGCPRVFVMVVGVEVPHAHVHLIPATRDLPDLPFPPIIDQTPGQLSEMADLITGQIAR